MTATMMLPVSKGGYGVARSVRPARDDDGRQALLRLLAGAGFTSADLVMARTINADVLRVLVSKVAPDANTYQQWADLVRQTRMSTDLLVELIDAHRDMALTLAELTALVRYARAMQPPGPMGPWLVAHARAGNRVQDVAPLGTWAPAWLVAWTRTGIAPGEEVPDVRIGEDLIWPYMDMLTRFPNLPEKVIAHTLAFAPYPRFEADAPGEWLRGAWNRPDATGLTALLTPR